MTVTITTQQELREEIGSDYYDQICAARAYTTKEEYANNDIELADILRVRETMKKLKTFSVDKAIAALDGGGTEPRDGRKVPKNSSGAIAKGQDTAKEIGSSLTQAAKQTKQTSKLTNLQRGARQAELDKQAFQTGYLHRAAQLEVAGAQALGEQLTSFDTAIQDQVDEEVDIESVLGGLDVSAPLEESDAEDFTRIGIPVGITFFV